MTFTNEISIGLNEADFATEAGLNHINSFLREHSIGDYALSADLDVAYLRDIATNPTITPEYLNTLYTFTIGSDAAIPAEAFATDKTLNKLVKKGELSEWNAFVAAHYAYANKFRKTIATIVDFKMEFGEETERFWYAGVYIVETYLEAKGVDVEEIVDCGEREEMYGEFMEEDELFNRGVIGTDKDAMELGAIMFNLSIDNNIYEWFPEFDFEEHILIVREDELEDDDYDEAVKNFGLEFMKQAKAKANA